MKRTLAGIAFAVLLCGGGALKAQTTGGIGGIVTDPANAVVPNVNLKLTNTATGVKQITISQASGGYRFDYLSPGTYNLEADVPGFRKAVVSGIVVEVGKSTAVNVLLEIGSVEQTTIVSAQATAVNISNAEVGTDVPTEFIRELPNQGRDILAMGDLAPGVTINSNAPAGAGAASSLIITGGTTANVNGSRDTRDNFYLDGVDNAAPYRHYALQFPNPDTVAEVQVTTSNSTPEYGRSVGGVFNVVTKSGTNEFHGDAYYYFRNKYLNANDAGNNKYGIPRPDDLLKTWGGTAGGPIIKNKTFFFASFERYTNNSQHIQSSVQAPTAQMLTGNFSELLHPTAASGLVPYQLYNPTNGSPIQNNRIDLYAPQLLNTVGLNLAKLLPTVANYGDYFIWTYKEPQDNNAVTAKLDHSFNEKHRISGSFLRTWGGVTFPAVDGEWSNIPAWGPEIDKSKQTTVSGHYTWIMSPTVVLEVTGGNNFFPANRDNANHSRDLTDFGAQNVPVSQQGARKWLPDLYLGNTLTGGQGWVSLFEQHNFRFGSTLSWIHDKHNVRFGFQTEREGVRQLNDQDNMNLQFTGGFSTLTQNTNSCCPNTVGTALADMLMGYSVNFQQQGLLNYNVFDWTHYFFAQDEWKISRRVTVSGGLRYEFYRPARESNNRMSSFIPGFQSALYPSVPVGIAFAGDKGIPANFYSPDYSNLAPRLAIAWDPKGDGRTAFRVGIGKFYSENAMQLAMLHAESNPWHPFAGCKQTIISNPWLDCQGPSYTTPPTPFTVTAQSLGNFDWSALEPLSGVVGYGPAKTPYSYQWNVTFEHNFGKYLTARTGYVGNRSRRLPQNISINYARLENDPVTGLPPSLDFQNLLDRQPYYPLYDNSLVLTSDVARSNYDGWQTSMELKAGGVHLRANYEYAHGVTNSPAGDPNDSSIQVSNPFNPSSDWGQYLIHHTFKLFYVWEMPFWRSEHTLFKKIAGGWRLSGAVRAYSGAPQNVTLGYDWNYDGIGGERPDLAGPVHYINQTSQQGFVQWIDLGTTNGQAGIDSNGNLTPQRGPFALPGGGTNHSVWGTTPFNNIFAPGSWSMDAALMKDFHFTERRYFELRFEGYNILNHPTLGGLDTTYTDNTFGQATSIYGNRAIQLALKFYF